MGSSWERVLVADRQCVLEAITDPNIFILPPQRTFAQAKNSMSALAKGDPEEAGIIAPTTRGTLHQLLPH